MDSHGNVTAEERIRRGKEAGDAAVRAGATASAIAAVSVAAIHALGSAFLPAYRALPVYPKRIVAACLVVGSYTFRSQLTHNEIVTRYNETDAEAREQRDMEMRRAFRAAQAVQQAALRRGGQGSDGSSGGVGAAVAAEVGVPAPPSHMR